jgi:hypothetical protein
MWYVRRKVYLKTYGGSKISKAWQNEGVRAKGTKHSVRFKPCSEEETTDH